MRCNGTSKGFSLVEILTVVAIIAILAGMLLGVGKHIKTQADEKLTAGQIEVLVSALEQYYETFSDFPFDAGVVYLQADFEDDFVDTSSSETITVTAGTPEDSYWSSSALYYFLDKGPNSRRLIDTLTDTLISNKDESGIALRIEIPTGNTPIDLVRFIDPWGSSLRYTYMTGDSFPVIVSAGKDGEFDTVDDLSSK